MLNTFRNAGQGIKDRPDGT